MTNNPWDTPNDLEKSARDLVFGRSIMRSMAAMGTNLWEV
jgi:hypothetical protein